MTVWLTAQQAAAHATQARKALSAGAAEVTVVTVYSWARRGHLTHTGMNADGHRLYELGAVARAELVTRKRALRLAGSAAPDDLSQPRHSHRQAAPDTPR